MGEWGSQRSCRPTTRDQIVCCGQEESELPAASRKNIGGEATAETPLYPADAACRLVMIPLCDRRQGTWSGHRCRGDRSSLYVDTVERIKRGRESHW